MAFLETPREYLNDFVIPNFNEYAAKAGDARLALNATTSCWHLADWVWLGKKHEKNYWLPFITAFQGATDWEQFCKYLYSQHPDLDLLRRISNGTKHFKRGAMDATATSITEKVVSDFVDQSLLRKTKFNASVPVIWTCITPAHVVVKDGNARVELKPMLESVINWWPKLLDLHGY